MHRVSLAASLHSHAMPIRTTSREPHQLPGTQVKLKASLSAEDAESSAMLTAGSRFLPLSAETKACVTLYLQLLVPVLCKGGSRLCRLFPDLMKTESNTGSKCDA